MGNYLALCIVGEMQSREAILKNTNVLQIIRNDGKTLELRNPISVRDLLANYINCYVGLFKEATQPLPLDYNLKIGNIYYLLPSLDDQSIDIQVDETRKSTTIKVVVTKEQLQQLLVSQHGRIIEDLVLSSVAPRNVCSTSAFTTWMPKLESIPEGSDLVC